MGEARIPSVVCFSRTAEDVGPYNIGVLVVQICLFIAGRRATALRYRDFECANTIIGAESEK